MRRIRRSIIRWGVVLLIAGLVMIAAALFLQQQLRPCAALDLALRRSGCVKVIELPQLSGVPYVSAAPDGRLIAVTAREAVLVIDLETERVIEEYFVTQIEHQSRHPLFFAIYSPDGTLTRDYQDRKRISLVLSKDGEKSIRFIERRPCAYIAIAQDGAVTREIPISGSVPVLSQLALSHDDARLAVVRGERFESPGGILPPSYSSRLSAWDLESGAPLIDVYDPDFADVDWLPNNQHLIVGLTGLAANPVRIALFELPEAALAPDQSAAPQCEPESDQIENLGSD